MPEAAAPAARVPQEVTFESAGERCAAWRLEGAAEALATEAGRPCVVMAHGLGGTRDSGLLPYAERFAEAGLDVLLFDYRHFGASSGEPRQLVSVRRQHADYEAALAYARGLPEVDPERVIVWGSSYSGGHALAIAARDPRLAAAITQTPMADGLAALRELASYAGVGQLARLTLAGLRDAAAALTGRPPVTVPLVGPPGSLAAMTSEEAEPGYTRIAGPSWRNEMCARTALEIGLYRPVADAARIRCPLLVQVADRDSVAPASAAREAAWRAREHGRPEVREYPIQHFEIYFGEAFERAVADQLHFLRRHLAEPARL